MPSQSSDTLSFGRYLKAIRESRKIALSSVADQLRVSIWHLMLIEAEDHDKLPDEVYVKGTVKAYAEAVGVDPADIIERYEINRRVWRRSLESEQELLKSGKRSVFRMMLALGVLSAVAFASITAVNRFQIPAGKSSEESPETHATDPKAFVFFEHDAQTPDPLEENTYTLNDRLRLKFVAMSEIRIEIRIDDGIHEHYMLNPKDELQVEAAEHFHFMISDANGARIYFNEQAVYLKGEPGESVNVLIRKKQAGQP